MSKEKLIKKQAREAMKGNTVPIIAGIAMTLIILILLENASYIFWIMFDAVDLELETMNAGSDIPYFAVLAGAVILATFLSPVLNGMFKTASNAVINKKCEALDVFYFFKGGRRYLKTMLINMVLFLIFGTLTSAVQSGLTAFMGNDGALGTAAAIISGVFKFLIYAWFVHYPLCLYAIDDSKSAARYMFGYIGFSFRHFWAFIRLSFSMLGWILLCFFVAPILYVGPYALCAAINSARWLKKLDDDKAERKYAPRPLYNNFTGYTGQ